MMGAIGQAIEGKDTIRLDLDNELEDARFFSRQEVLAAIEGSAGWTLSKKDLAKVDENVAARLKEEEEQKRKEGTARGLSSNGKEGENRGREWDQKDSGSVANVSNRRFSPSPTPSASSDSSETRRRRRRPPFKIPGHTAIAHVLISSWARGEANFSPDNLRGKM